VGVVEVDVVSSSSFEQAEITKITTMLMIILIIIFFIIPHFEEVKFRINDTLPSFIIFVKSWGGRLWRVSDCEELVGVME
jgi:hypothetical protein